MYYKNNDYTISIKIIDDIERYFIKFHGLTDSPEHEISLEIFMLYLSDENFRNPIDKQHLENRRHIAKGDFKYLTSSDKLANYTSEDEDRAVIMYDIEAALKTCTPVQQRRFRLYYFQDYTYEKIARLENCDKRRVQKSVIAAMEKIKKYFL